LPPKPGDEFLAIYRGVTYFTVTSLFSGALYLTLRAYETISDNRQRLLVQEIGLRTLQDEVTQLRGLCLAQQPQRPRILNGR
jgi:hypothetical protein